MKLNQWLDKDFFECKCETWGKLRRVKHIPKQSGRCVKIKEKKFPRSQVAFPLLKLGPSKSFNSLE